MAANTPMGRERLLACAAQMPVLHALGGRVEEAALLTVTSSYAPLFLPSTSLLDDLVSFYGLRADFPASRLVVRSPTVRSLLLLADEVSALLRADGRGALKVVNTGVRLFEKDEAKGTPCAFRVVHDGLAHVVPYMSRQLVHTTPDAAIRVLKATAPIGAGELAASEPALHAELGRTCRPGSVVLTTRPHADGLPLHVVVLYAPSGAVSAMVKGLEKSALLFRLQAGSGAAAAVGTAGAAAEF